MSKPIFLPIACVCLILIALNACAAPPTAIPSSPISAIPTTSSAQVIWKSTQEAKPLAAPSSLALDKQGNLYVYDSAYPRVLKYSRNGEFVSLWDGIRGTGDGQFTYMIGFGDLLIDNENNVLITDTGNSHVQKFNGDGKFLAAWGSNGKGEGQFGFPNSIAVDAEGIFFVLDYQEMRIQKFDRTGKFIAMFGDAGPLGGQFTSPSGIALDSQGNIYVADRGNGRVQKLDRAGKFLADWFRCGTNVFSRPIDVTVDKADNLYVVDVVGDLVCKFDRTGQYLTSWGGKTGSGDGEFDSPSSIVVDDADNIYVAEFGNKRVQKFKQR